MYSTGAAAVEAALRLAKSYTGNYEVISFHQAWHGRTLGAMSLMGGFPLKHGYGPFAPGVYHSANANCYRCPLGLTPPGCEVACAGLVDRVYEQSGEQRLAAVIVEPVQGLAGALELGADFLRALRERCSEVGALLICDEVQCGMGRSGVPFAAARHGVVPDLVTSAKALGNGYPCAALLLSPTLAAALPPDSLGTTFGGGPMACAAIEAVIEAIESEELLARVRHIGAYVRERCIVGPVTAHQGAGLLIGLRTRRPAREVDAELLAAGILAGTATDPHVLRLLPPYILESAHVELLRATLEGLAS